MVKELFDLKNVFSFQNLPQGIWDLGLGIIAVGILEWDHKIVRNTQVLAINGELKSKFEALKKDLVGKRKNKHDTLDPGGPENNGSSGGGMGGSSDHAHALHTHFESVNI